MLQNIHDKAKGWVAYAIVGFIAIPFTLFGINSYLGGSDSLVAAVVNGEEILAQQVQNSVVQQRQRLAQVFGGKLPPGFNDEAIKQQALEQIVNQTLLRQESQDNGYRVSNQEVYDTIAEIPAFQRNGQFDPKTYELVLASQRRNKAGFEAEIRESLSNQQFSQAISKSAFLPEAELKRFQMLQGQTRTVETYTLKKADFSSEVSVSEDEIKSYYESNQAKFMTPEKVKLGYVALKQSELAKTIDVNEEELRAFYDENSDRYTDPEQRKLAHILIKIDTKSASPEDAEKKALEKAQAIYDQIIKGTKSFEDLAKTESDDAFSAKKSGDIGSIAKGDMGPLFEQVAFSLEKGAVSKPIKAEAGFEIIKLLDVIPAVQKSFADVKTELKKSYRQEKAERLFLDKSDKLQTLAFENDSSLDEAADAVGVKVKTSDWIEKNKVPVSGDLLSSPKVVAAAFSDEVLGQGKNSELIEVDEDTAVVVRVQEHQQRQQKPLKEVSKEIVDILSDQKLRKLLIEKGEIVLKGLNETGDWSALKSVGGSIDKLEKIDSLKRDDKKLAPALVGKIFSIQKPQDGKKSFGNVILPEGDYVLIGLLAVEDGSTDNADETIRQAFTQMLASREQTALLKSLREKAKVELFPENIQ